MNAVDSSRMPGDNEHPKQTEGGALNLAEVWGEIESQRFAEEFDLDDQEISLLNRGILRIIKSSERTRNREVFNS